MRHLASLLIVLFGLIPGTTHANTVIGPPVATGGSPTDIAVNPVNGKVYVANLAGDSVSIIGEPPSAIPLTTAIGALPNHRTVTSTLSFSVTATSAFSPNASTPNRVYFQVDTHLGAWTPVTLTVTGIVGTGMITTTPLSPGLHTLYAFATDGQDATSTATTPNAGPLTGQMTAYSFVVDPPAAMMATGATALTTTIGSAFPSVLTTTVTNLAGLPLQGVEVVFQTPPSGPTASFAAGNVVTVTTDASGIASSPVLTASLQAGSYPVTATVSGVVTPTVFSLTNTKAPVTVSLAGAPNPSTVGQSVTFTVSVSGMVGIPTGSVTFTTDSGFSETVTLSGGVATASTSSLPVGSRVVTATYSGDASYLPGMATTSQTVNEAEVTGTAIAIPAVPIGSAFP